MRHGAWFLLTAVAATAAAAEFHGLRPTDPGDPEFKTLCHKVAFQGVFPALPPDDYSVALWLPDAAPSLRVDPRYSIRLANRDTTWWTDNVGHYGANVLGLVSAK